MSFVLFSCENATCAVPEAWRDLFRGEEETVQSSAGWEPGALNLAQGLAMRFRTPLAHGDVTRLLIDLGGAGEDRWSRFSLKLSDVQRGKLVDRHQGRYQETLNSLVGEALRHSPQVVHVLVHTDPAGEAVTLATREGDVYGTRWAEVWAAALRDTPGALEVRVESVPVMPAPAEVLHAALGGEAYTAIVLRVPQSCFLESRPWKWDKLRKHVIATCEATAAELRPGAVKEGEPEPG